MSCSGLNIYYILGLYAKTNGIIANILRKNYLRFFEKLSLIQLAIETSETTVYSMHPVWVGVWILACCINCCARGYSTDFSRRDFLRQTLAADLAFKSNAARVGALFEPIKKKVLIVGCNKAGFAIMEELKKQDSSVHVTVTTTKPKRLKWLKKLADDAVLIPQLATPDDPELTNAVRACNAVVIADAVRIFSVHIFVRTAARIRQILEKTQWDGVLGMLSSENAYGSVLGGQMLTEDCGIFPNIKHVPAPELRNNVLSWHVNPYAIGLALRQAEATIVDGPQPAFVFRTAGVWDDAAFREAAMYTDGKAFPACVADSYISFCTTKKIGKAVTWALKRKISGVFNLREKDIKGLTRAVFYENIQKRYNVNDEGRIIWDPHMDFDEDKLFCMDVEPFLPVSQRSNSQMSCAKLLEKGFFK